MLLCAVLFVMANVDYQFRKRHKSASNDSVAINKTLKTDSANRQPIDTTQMDSLQLAIYHHNKLIDDSIRLDSLNRQKKNGIDAPVNFSANDSMVYDARNKTAFLYGTSSVKYENMDLKSEHITLNMDSSLVHATGVRDTATKGLTGTPVFTLGSDNYESDTMAFNFKTKKGLIDNVKTQQEEGYLSSELSKRNADGEIFLKHAIKSIQTSILRFRERKYAQVRMLFLARHILLWLMFLCHLPFLMASFHSQRSIQAALSCLLMVTKVHAVSIYVTGDITLLSTTNGT